MSTGTWTPGTLYIPGSLVRPRSVSAVVQSDPENSDFEAGNSGWTFGAGFSIGEFGAAFNGTWSLQFDDTDPAVQVALNDNVVPVTPGFILTASAQIQQGGSSSGQAGGFVLLRFYDASMVFVSEALGNSVTTGSGGQWKISNVSGTTPLSAAFAQVGIGLFRLTGSSPVYADVVNWNYAFSAPPPGLIYRAVQALSGYSGSGEPAWPTSVGLTVVDNEVTWEAVLTSRVVYEAHPILKSGSSEPDFPLVIGTTVADGTIIWEATSRQITDPRCPQSKYVITGASKIFAGDRDIIPYSATNNPLDWSTKDDAGFLPFGLQRFGSNPVLGLGLYRSNLVAFNEAGAQMWQIDEDPQNMALLDAVPVGCRFHRSIQPVANDLAFLTDVGIRNFGIAAASTNLQAGDFAKPIDPLVKASVKAAETPIGLFYPGTGQYMLFFGADGYVLTFNGATATSASRSRYELPSEVDDWTLLDGQLYLRSGDKVWRLDEDVFYDDAPTAESAADSEFQLLYGPEAFSYNEAKSPWNDDEGRFELILGQPGGEPLIYYIGDPALTIDSDPRPAFRIYWEIVDATTNMILTWTALPPNFVQGQQFQSVETDLGSLNGSSGVINVDIAEGYSVFYFFVVPQFGGEGHVNIEVAKLRLGDGFNGYLAWQYLDLQAFGDDVMLHGFDLVGAGQVDVSFGYNQSNTDHATNAYTVQAETLNGMPIAMPIKAPSVQLRLTFAARQAWKWQAARLYDSPVNT